MFTEIRLTNFKAFSCPQSAAIKPITLIYGPNSSGKSSLMQSLLLFKQTLDAAEDADTLLLPKGNLIDLGGYREFINGHDATKPFAFELKTPISKEKRFLPPIVSKALFDGNYSSFRFRVEMSFDPENAAASLTYIKLYLDNDSRSILTFKFEREGISLGPKRILSRRSSRSDFSSSAFRLEQFDIEHQFWEKLWQLADEQIKRDVIPKVEQKRRHLERRLRIYKDPNHPIVSDEAKSPTERRIEQDSINISEQLKKLQSYNQRTFTSDIEKGTGKVLLLCRNFLPVGMIREEEGRMRGTFSFLEEFEGLGSELDGIPSMILHAASGFRSALEAIIYIGPLRDYPERHYIFSGNLTSQVGKSGKMVPDVLFKKAELLDEVNRQLDIFGLGYELRVSSVNDKDSDLQDVFALRLFDKRTGVQSSILDVGFGISQVLPIIVQSMLARDKVLCIEQPEIHLHPRLQADLGSLFAECIKSPYSNRFLIETHSQHLILRLQRLIRDKIITADDVCVLYIDREDNGSQCLELRLDQDGDFIDQWPNGFFEEGYNEIFK